MGRGRVGVGINRGMVGRPKSGERTVMHICRRWGSKNRTRLKNVLRRHLGRKNVYVASLRGRETDWACYFLALSQEEQ